MTLATLPNHSPNCSGCPACNPFAALLLGLGPEAQSTFLAGSTRALVLAAEERRFRAIQSSGATDSRPYTRALEALKATPPPQLDPEHLGPQPYTRALAGRSGPR